jgi:hypothetical protein
LNTGVNTIDAQAYINSNEEIMKTCDANNNIAFKNCHAFAQSTIQEYCMAVSAELNSNTLNGEALLMRYVALWTSYKTYTHSINKLFSYLNRHHLGKDGKLVITEECMLIWKNKCIQNVKSKIIKVLIAQINRDRSGENTRREVIKQVIKSFKDMGMKAPKTLPSDGILEWTGEIDLEFYMRELIEPIAHATKEFWIKEAQKWNTTENCPDYIDIVDQKLC